MHQDEASNPFVMTRLPDTPDARLFVELSSYAADLVEAREALELSLRGAEKESPLADASGHLVRAAVIAYCRAMMASKVRPSLTTHIEIPPEYGGIHQTIRIYRNATVAHSQSELAVTYAFGVWDAETGKLRDVMGPTLSIPLPQETARDFLELVDVVEDALDQVIEPVRTRLKRFHGGAGRSASEPISNPKVAERLASEFDPNTKRDGYPTGHTIYLDRAGPDSAP